jgi:predicted transcriptional regulator
MDDVLDLETRRNIYALIKNNPGLHLSKIANMLDMRTSHVEYHLLYLEKHEIITSEKEKGFKRFYIRGQIGVKDKQYLFILRQKTILEIILFLLKQDAAQHKEILEHVNVNASTLSYHLNKLVKKDIVEVNRYGDQKGYQVKNRTFLIDLLIRYKPFQLFEGFSDIWSDLSI